jgi:hypothetical protein
MDEIKPTPRGTLSGMLADALAAVDSKLPRMASEIIGVPAMARTMDRVSYGEPLTTGSGMTTRPRADTMDALLGAAPIAQGMNALGRKAVPAMVRNALAPTSPGMAQRGAIVYHGSPHTFDKFDMSKIGTGEGAQAYGHGLYFADNPGVAQDYQRSLSDAAVKVGGKQATPAKGSPADIALAWLEGSDFKTAREQIDIARSIALDKNKPSFDKALRVLDFWEKKGATPATGGSLYKVDLPDEHIAKMLDWDKPLSQQSPEIRASLQKLGELMPDSNLRKGGSAMGLLESRLGGRDKAAAALKEAGIPGIKYLDQGSRGTGAGTSNYVVFDDALPKILERNGKSLAEQLAEKLK